MINIAYKLKQKTTISINTKIFEIVTKQVQNWGIGTKNNFQNPVYISAKNNDNDTKPSGYEWGYLVRAEGTPQVGYIEELMEFSREN